MVWNGSAGLRLFFQSAAFYEIMISRAFGGAVSVLVPRCSPEQPLGLALARIYLLSVDRYGDRDKYGVEADDENVRVSMIE